eukprot:scaffold119382_cov20-Tisochrysis_lutea.AAC.1
MSLQVVVNRKPHVQQRRVPGLDLLACCWTAAGTHTYTHTRTHTHARAHTCMGFANSLRCLQRPPYIALTFPALIEHVVASQTGRCAREGFKRAEPYSHAARSSLSTCRVAGNLAQGDGANFQPPTPPSFQQPA